MNDINRHIVVVWQSLTTLVGAFATWSLVEKNIISLDIAVALIMLIAIWVIENAYDSAYWYNRNLVIIANIERQFLKQTDLKDIHYYFGQHRKTGKMITHIKLQLFLALGIAGLVFFVYLYKTILPNLCDKLTIENYFPIFVLIFGLYRWYACHNLYKEKYDEFLKNSPGTTIDTTGLVYGAGHPTSKQ
ncbi:hypothetical protein [Ancylobacter novellus]|uniref:hypothetical protein n=1 Tax=Ancylobacter novellus TaxID=921 RepID=UPI001184B713|nr:hypothetical protein [Ancylobacter novellus]